MDEKCIPTGLDIYCNLEEKKIKISPHLKSGSDPGGGGFMMFHPPLMYEVKWQSFYISATIY